MATYRTLKEAPLKGKRVLLRAGFDLPMQDGKVQDDARIRALLPTMKLILKSGASLVILAHQDRPKGKRVESMSQAPIAAILKKLLKTDVAFVDDCIGREAEAAAKSLKPGKVLLLENLRFHKEEEKNDAAFAKKLAKLGDLYVNDAFTNCHRNHASMVALAKLLPSYAGLQLEEELTHLDGILDDPRRPCVLILGGAKMETKVPIIERFLPRGDEILLGGALANTFLAARGFDVGSSLYEDDFVELAQELMLQSDKEKYAKIVVPRDVVVATEPSEKAAKLDLPLEDVVGDMKIFDIGKVSIKRYIQSIKNAGTIIWNGPVGLSELNRFSHATKRIAEAIADATKKRGAISIIGGGDTLDFHHRYDYPLKDYTFVSTGGGAMLELLSGKPLPALRVLAKK